MHGDFFCGTKRDLFSRITPVNIFGMSVDMLTLDSMSFEELLEYMLDIGNEIDQKTPVNHVHNCEPRVESTKRTKRHLQSDLHIKQTTFGDCTPRVEKSDIKAKRRALVQTNIKEM